MRSRLPLVLSATALVVALLGSTPLGDAATTVFDAQNADKVDGIHASRAPTAGKLLALSSSVKFPRSVIPRAYALVNPNGGGAPALVGAYTRKFTGVRRGARGVYCLTPGSGIVASSLPLAITTEFGYSAGSAGFATFYGASLGRVCRAGEFEVHTFQLPEDVGPGGGTISPQASNAVAFTVVVP